MSEIRVADSERKPRVVRKLGTAIEEAAKFVRDEVVGRDPEEAARRLREKGEPTATVNPTGAKIGKPVVRIINKLVDGI